MVITEDIKSWIEDFQKVMNIKYELVVTHEFTNDLEQKKSWIKFSFKSKVPGVIIYVMFLVEGLLDPKWAERLERSMINSYINSLETQLIENTNSV